MRVCEVDTETSSSHIKLDLLKQDSKNEKTDPETDSVVRGRHPLTKSNEVSLKPDSQHTHAKTTNDSIVSGFLSLYIDGNLPLCG